MSYNAINTHYGNQNEKRSKRKHQYAFNLNNNIQVLSQFDSLHYSPAT